MNSSFRYPLIMLSALLIVRFTPALAAIDPGDLGPPRGAPIEEATVAPRQPMCWSSKGAHLLLQVRCAVLDDRLESLFREWHPQFRRRPAASELPAI